MLGSLGIILWNFQGHVVARVVTQLIPIFQRMGIRILFLTGSDPKLDRLPVPSGINRVDIGFGPDRQDRLAKALKANAVELVVDHEYYEIDYLAKDFETVRRCGARFVIHHHNVMSMCLASSELKRGYSGLMKLYPKMDAIIALSRVDECFFNAIGCRAFYIQNPVAHIDRLSGSEKNGSNLIWIGRIAPTKRLDEAIRVFRLVLEKCPLAKLHVIGDCQNCYAEKIVKGVQNDDRLREAVVFEGFHANVFDFLKTADAMLMTSAVEGDPCIVSESLSQGVPVVCYDLPYVESIRVGARRGVIAVPQMDRQAAADAVIKLLQDKEWRQTQSEAARTSYERMRDYDFEGRYRQFFDLVLSDGAFGTKPDEEDYKLALRTLSEHAGIAMDELRSWRNILMRVRGILTCFLRHPIHYLSAVLSRKNR